MLADPAETTHSVSTGDAANSAGQARGPDRAAIARRAAAIRAAAETLAAAETPATVAVIRGYQDSGSTYAAAAKAAENCTGTSGITIRPNAANHATAWGTTQVPARSPRHRWRQRWSSIRTIRQRPRREIAAPNSRTLDCRRANLCGKRAAATATGFRLLLTILDFEKAAGVGGGESRQLFE